ncbi:hypothetical protein NLN84_23535, partial [Citrobacter portucalensis]|uniref:hypothetical protein n=2 Tax=Citrobacter portucalensis TaxID=1639133 RepID=UPI00226B1391
FIFISMNIWHAVSSEPRLTGLAVDCDLADCSVVFINDMNRVDYSKDGRYFSSLITVSGGCE